MAKAVAVESFSDGGRGTQANFEMAGQRQQGARAFDDMANTLLASEAGSSARAQVSAKWSLAAAGASAASHSADYDGRKVDAMRFVAQGNEEATQLQTQTAGTTDAAFGSLNRSLV